MRVLITGATGFIGTHLCRRLAGAEHEVIVLTRDPDSASRRIRSEARAYRWLPMASPPPPEALQDVDAIVNLLGESIAGRWSEAKKRAIMDSRVVGTRNLIAAVERVEKKPKVLVSASAVGYYTVHADEEITEDSPAGTGFLAEVCNCWENEAMKAEQLGLRVVRLRNAMVLGDGGVLAAMLPIFRAGIGGPLGRGRQWWPWIHIDDVVELILHAITKPALAGAVNASSPEPVRQKEFARALAQPLRRPALLPTPSLLLRLALGEFASELLASRRVIPKRALDAGYEFRYPELGPALRDVLL
jgi:uncharacterized protein (TIGR01777 family)